MKKKNNEYEDLEEFIDGETRKIINDPEKRHNFINKIKTVLFIVFLIMCLLTSYYISEKIKKDIDNTVVEGTYSITDIIDINELSLCRSLYEGIAEVKNEKKPDKINYYVKYKADIIATVNVDDIVLKETKQDDGTVYTVKLPDIKLSVNVRSDISDEDIMYVKDKYNDENTHSIALKEAKIDADNECTKNGTITKFARLQFEEMVHSMVDPLLQKNDKLIIE